MLAVDIYIPSNNFGILEEYYGMKEVVGLLRTYCTNPEVVYFIADMMEP